MPDDRPAWMPKYSTDEDTTTADEETTADADADSTYTPWRQQKEATGTFEPERTDAFAAPPGLDERPVDKRAPALLRWRRTHTAAMMLNWTGGFLFFAGLFTLIIGGSIAAIIELDWEYHGERHALVEAADARGGTALVGWSLLLGSAPFLAAGTGLLHQRTWARPLGIIMAVLGLLFIPLGTILNGIALGMFGGGAGEDT